MEVLISMLAILAFVVIMVAVVAFRPQDEGGPMYPYWDADADARVRVPVQSHAYHSQSHDPPSLGGRLVWVLLVMMAFIALAAMVMVVQTSVL